MDAFTTPLKNLFNKGRIYESGRKFIFRVLSAGPILNHVAFILDGNRRYARSRNLPRGEGHRAGFTTLISMLSYCYEFGINYVTIYAFSIDNFKREREEVEDLMDLFQEKVSSFLEKESIVNTHGIRVYFVGDLKRLREPLQVAARNVMDATASNTKAVLVICVAYKFSDEIVHAVKEACNENDVVNVGDIEKHMYTSVVPGPDMVVRTSGENRLSDFLLWQTSYAYLYYPKALWPDISFWHLIWGVLNYQRVQPYLEKKKKQL